MNEPKGLPRFLADLQPEIFIDGVAAHERARIIQEVREQVAETKRRGQHNREIDTILTVVALILLTVVAISATVHFPRSILLTAPTIAIMIVLYFAKSFLKFIWEEIKVGFNDAVQFERNGWRQQNQ